MNIRVGYGFDVHQLKKDRPCILGGVLIPSNIGPDGHSDADVLIHAICDALLGAANLRDIGFHFPNTDARFKNIDSKKLLAEVVKLLATKNYRIGNVDATVVLESPKLNPHIQAMQKVLSSVLNIEEDAVSIKATTNELLGYVGREEGVNASAVVLIFKD
ncbi:2-C-methyl-D-erythritol 2,4-cyclodiphosphate synthase [Bacteroidota bacterium]|nr:2-C-methyl-D-erythritol 2,4-cyclodiphosphate synthase [Bacteroidota bacterium]